MIRLFVSDDAAALAVGSDAVAHGLSRSAAAAQCDVEIVRVGSRGLVWLEPLVEVETPLGRHGFGRVEPEDVAGVFEAAVAAARSATSFPHPKALGPMERFPWLARQRRFTFRRCGVVDPTSLADFCAHDGLRGFARAVAIGPAGTLEEVTRSGLRGRGGAGSATGAKWKAVARIPADRRFVVCNANEGDSGTFADRMIMEGDPFSLIEGMMIAGLAVGATRGYIYSRPDYRHANAKMEKAIERARAAALLGQESLGKGYSFEIELRVGTGAYVCGEETALLESLEGRRGIVRTEPPLPIHRGLFGRPTVVNSVLSLATIPAILANGAEAYAALGAGRSRGTVPLQLAGNVRRGGLFEAPFGLSLGEIVDEIGGGTASGRPVRAVQCGGPLGAYFPRAQFDTAYAYEPFAARGGLIGHGGIVVFDDSVDMARQARFAMAFCAAESCGSCAPCRVGSTRGVETLDRIIAGEHRAGTLAALEELCETMTLGSLCALGRFAPSPVLSALRHFPDDFGLRPMLQAAE